MEKNVMVFIFRDLGAMDTDSNYFSGGETERGESKLSNYTDRKLSNSSSCSDNSCPGTNYFSDSNFSDSYSVTTERRHVYECRYTETSRHVQRGHDGQANGHSTNSSPAVARDSFRGRNCDRKATL
jgi:hypothetical protein